MDEKEIQEAVIDRIHDLLSAEGKRIREDNTKSMQQKLIEVDVLLDTMKFLTNYRQNVKILQKDLESKKYNRGERE